MPAFALCSSLVTGLRPSGAISCSKGRCLQASTPRSALQLRRQAPASRRQLCRATAEKEGTQQQAADQPQVPDTPPTPSGAAQQQPGQATGQQGEPSVSIEDIQQRAAAMRQQKQAAQAKEGLVEGVMEEVGLIKWPALGKAALNTLLVIAIVAGTAAALLAINSLLTELSDVLY